MVVGTMGASRRTSASAWRAPVRAAVWPASAIRPTMSPRQSGSSVMCAPSSRPSRGCASLAVVKRTYFMGSPWGWSFEPAELVHDGRQPLPVAVQVVLQRLVFEVVDRRVHGGHGRDEMRVAHGLACGGA